MVTVYDTRTRNAVSHHKRF